MRAALFQKADRPGYSALRVAAADIKPAIFGHAEFTAFNATATKLFAKWKAANTPRLKGLRQGRPSQGPHRNHRRGPARHLREGARCSTPTTSISTSWTTGPRPCRTTATSSPPTAGARPPSPGSSSRTRTKKTKAKPDFTLGKKKYSAELIPPALVIARYFAKEQAAIDALEAQLAALAQQMEEMAEEHGGEGGLLEDAKNDKDKLTKASVAARLKEIGKTDPDTADERQALQDYLALIEQEADTGAKLKTAQDALMAKVDAKYGKLTEDEIKTLVVDDKWLATLAAAVQGELDRVSQTLTGRIRQLAERYATPLPQLTDEVATLAARVDGHLKKMGCTVYRRGGRDPGTNRKRRTQR